MTEHDPVNSPAHYVQNNYEVVDIAEAFGIDQDAYLFNVLKYILRAGKKEKDKFVQDLEKASWYLKRRITRLKSSNEST